MSLFSDRHKATVLRNAYEALDDMFRHGYVPSEGEEVLGLALAVLGAIALGCPEPASDDGPGELPEDPDRLPVEIQDEREPPGSE